MNITKFNEKFNKLDGNIYTVEEKVDLTNGIYEAALIHDNVDSSTVNVYTGSKLTGNKVNTYVLSTPSLTPWKTSIRVLSNVTPVYITYETTGDQVEAEDVNNLQTAVNDTQTAVNNEVARAAAAETVLTTNLNAESSRAKAAENTLTSNLTAESARAAAAETTLTNTINTNKPVWDDKYTKNEVDNKFSQYTTNMDWKESVANFAAIATTYPTPADGWTVNVNDTDITYRYNGSSWIPISANSIPLATASVDGKMAAADKSKLDGIAAAATKTAASSTNGNIKNNDVEVVVYTHPATHAPGIIVQDANNRFSTDSEKTNWNAAFTHISDVIKHITSAERTLWNTVSNKLDATANAVSASKWATSRAINLNGDVTGSASADGSADITITATVGDDSHNHTSSTITDFLAAARATTLTGLSTATNAIITVTDTILAALGKLQAQISANLTTLTNHTGNTSNPHSTTASQVGLGNVTNESKATMFTSPTFTGVPIAPTAADGNSSTQIATNAFVMNAIANKTSITGNAATAAKLQTARYINGFSFDGSADITVADSTKLPLAGGTLTGALTGTTISATSFIGPLTGNASTATTAATTTGNSGTATKLQVARTINGVSFDGSANITVTAAPTAHTHDDRYYTETESDAKYATKSEVSAAGYGDMTKAIYDTDADGIVDNSETAIKLATARTINGVSFDGSANITVADSTKLPLSGGTLTGALTGTTIAATTFTGALTGNAATATKLAAARAINLTGDVVGSVNFDGSAAVSITTTLKTGLTWNDIMGV